MFNELFKRSPFDITPREVKENLSKMHEYMEQVFNDALSGINQRFSNDILMPLADVKENEKSFTVTTDIPGIDKADIELEVKDNVLIVKADKKQEENVEEEGYIRHERSYIKAYREIPLMSDVTDEGATAQLKDGVLTITIPKVPKLEKPKIQVE